MVKWEYKILTAAYPNVAHGIHVVKYVDGQEIPNWKQRNWGVNQALNELGQDGWELVEIVWRQYGDVATAVADPLYFLKRPNG